MSDSKQGWMRGAAVAVLVLVGGLGWQVNLNQALTEANAAYDRLAAEARAALEEERERGRQAVLDAEARGRKAADDAVASVRKAKMQGATGKKGNGSRRSERRLPKTRCLARQRLSASTWRQRSWLQCKSGTMRPMMRPAPSLTRRLMILRRSPTKCLVDCRVKRRGREPRPSERPDDQSS